MKRVLILSILTLGITTLANAQATRTWVSGVGDDANPCSRTAPCKTFAGAISKTASPGIINCLDPGGFGAVTVTKSVTIDCTGTMGSVLSSGVQGIVINALTTDKIVIRNVDINGAGTTIGTNGVNIIQAAAVDLEDVKISTYSNAGLVTTNTSNSIAVSLNNCQILYAVQGVQANSGAPGTSTIMVNNSHIFRNTNGIDVSGVNNYAECTRCSIEQNSGAGFQIEQTGSTGSLESTALVHNATGVQAGIPSPNAPTIRLSRCFITNNTTNGITGSGTTKCFGNNMIDGNTGTQTCTTIGAQQQ